MQSHRVLLVEDSAEDRLLFQLGVERARLPWQLLFASDVPSAELLVQEEKVALVVSDMSLGTTRADDLLRHLKKIPAGPPAVILTGSADNDTMARLLEIGAVEVIQKPYTTERLTEVLLHLHERWILNSDTRSRSTR